MWKQGKKKVGTFGIGNCQTAVLDSVNNDAQNAKFYFTETEKKLYQCVHSILMGSPTIIVLRGIKYIVSKLLKRPSPSKS